MYEWFTGNPDSFNFIPCNIAGDECVLIIPKDEKAVGAPWYEDDKRYRSSVWRACDGYPVSLGYKKFVNFGEQPEFEPIDPLRTDLTAVEKVDGSCLICSKYKGEYIFRTRGTIDATGLPNGDEIMPLVERYSVKELLDELGENHTILFEWVTPTNVLCVRYEDAELYLTGIVKHADYSYFKQDELDSFAAMHGLKRPRTYQFDCNAESVKEDVLNWMNKEGVVVYFGKEQQVLKKMKSEWHHHLHVARILVGNIRKLYRFLADKGAFNGDAAGTMERISNIVQENLEWEVVEYYSEELSKLAKAHAKLESMIVRAKELTSGITDHKDIMSLLGTDSIPDNVIWSAWRDKPIRDASFDRLILQIAEEI